MKKLLTMGIAGALAAGLSFGAFAATGATTEVSVAHAHALMAQNAKTVAMSHTHLHHVVNCLVGPKGTGFDAKAGDPCKGEGNGAIGDAAGNAALDAKLKTALTDAQAGLKATTLTAAQADAGKVAATLQDTGTPAKKASGGYSW